MFEAELAARERIARAYDAALRDVVQVPARVPDSDQRLGHLCDPVAEFEARSRMQEGLQAAGVPTAIYYPRPLHHQPAYRDAHDGTALPVAEDLADAHPGAADPSRSVGGRRGACLCCGAGVALR